MTYRSDVTVMHSRISCSQCVFEASRNSLICMSRRPRHVYGVSCSRKALRGTCCKIRFVLSDEELSIRQAADITVLADAHCLSDTTLLNSKDPCVVP
jgi:hypothetical protein